MAATWDPDKLHQVGEVIADEGRAKYYQAQRDGQHGDNRGLTYWAPNINIFRDPRWGRGQETYGEDPYLTSRMGVNFIEGVQTANGPYLEAMACAKHYRRAQRARTDAPRGQRQPEPARPLRDLPPAVPGRGAGSARRRGHGGLQRGLRRSDAGERMAADRHPAHAMGLRRPHRLRLRRDRRRLGGARLCEGRHRGRGPPRSRPAAISPAAATTAIFPRRWPRACVRKPTSTRHCTASSAPASASACSTLPTARPSPISR